MTIPKYTYEGLPIVSMETYEAVVSHISEVGRIDASFDKELVKKIEQENPLVCKLIEDIAKYCDEEEFKEGFAAGVAMTYELLKNQAGNNKLED